MLTSTGTPSDSSAELEAQNTPRTETGENDGQGSGDDVDEETVEHNRQEIPDEGAVAHRSSA